MIDIIIYFLDSNVSLLICPLWVHRSTINSRLLSKTQFITIAIINISTAHNLSIFSIFTIIILIFHNFILILLIHALCLLLHKYGSSRFRFLFWFFSFVSARAFLIIFLKIIDVHVSFVIANRWSTCHMLFLKVHKVR